MGEGQTHGSDDPPRPHGALQIPADDGRLPGDEKQERAGSGSWVSRPSARLEAVGLSCGIFRGHERLGLLGRPDIVLKRPPHRPAAFGRATVWHRTRSVEGVSTGEGAAMGVPASARECLSSSRIVAAKYPGTSRRTRSRMVSAEQPGRMPI